MKHIPDVNECHPQPKYWTPLYKSSSKMNECDVFQGRGWKRWLCFSNFGSLSPGPRQRGNGFHPSFTASWAHFRMKWLVSEYNPLKCARSGAMFWVESLPIRVKTCWSIFVVEGCGSIILIILDMITISSKRSWAETRREPLLGGAIPMNYEDI